MTMTDRVSDACYEIQKQANESERREHDLVNHLKDVLTKPGPDPKTKAILFLKENYYISL